jgi:hypothetical protein
MAPPIQTSTTSFFGNSSKQETTPAATTASSPFTFGSNTSAQTNFATSNSNAPSSFLSNELNYLLSSVCYCSKYPITGYWDYDMGRENNADAYANARGRVDIEGCCGGAEEYCKYEVRACMAN